MVPLDSSVTSLGNRELSSLDKQKLQCMYDCNSKTNQYSNCGGHFHGSSGKLSGSCCCGGDWLLRSDVGKGIVIEFSAFGVRIAKLFFNQFESGVRYQETVQLNILAYGLDLTTLDFLLGNFVTPSLPQKS